MKIEIHQPLSIFAQGVRDNMEDCILPAHGKAAASDKWFVVCDGMGGHVRGEIASKLVCKGFDEYFSANPFQLPGDPYFLGAFNHVQEALDGYISRYRDTRGMGTTVVLAFICDRGIHVMHCGDSRLYHFRGNDLIWRTLDHNMANELVRKGNISLEEAMRFPKSNVITRAMQGNNVAKTSPDIHLLQDLRAGDYLFLCTDGITDGISDNQLTEIIASDSSDAEKISLIESLCEGNSGDNYSAFLIRLKQVKND